MPDRDNRLFTVTDLKQYIYCARILYYHACLPDVRPVTYKMEAGIQSHRSEPSRAQRRKYSLNIDGEHHFDVSVQSARLGLSGQIDEVLHTENEWIPVDFKLAKRVGDHFKIQLTAYALLLEDTLSCKVRRGLIYLIPTRKTIEIPITQKLKDAVFSTLDQMWSITQSEQIPQAADQIIKCQDCEFRRFCNDV